VHSKFKHTSLLLICMSYMMYQQYKYVVLLAVWFITNDRLLEGQNSDCVWPASAIDDWDSQSHQIY